MGLESTDHESDALPTHWTSFNINIGLYVSL